VALEYSFVLPPVGPADNTLVREMFDDIKTYVDSFVPSGGAAPFDAQYVTLSADATLTNERALTGTSNQVIITDNGAGSTVVLSLPQSIAITSDVQFNSLHLGAGTSTDSALFFNEILEASRYGVYIADDLFGGFAFESLRLRRSTQTIVDFYYNATFGKGLYVEGNTATTPFGTVNTPSVTIRNDSGTQILIKASATTGSYNLTLPDDNGLTDQALVTDGSGILSWLSVAEKDLSNLASTAVNVSIIPAAPGAIDLGNTTLPWANVISEAILIMQAAPGVWFTSFIASSGQSGNVAYTLPDDNGSPNQVLTTDGSGVLSWGAGTGGGAATVQLDNLTGVAINTSLISDTTNTDDLGSSSIAWRSLYLKTGLLIQETGAGTDAVTIQAPAALAASYSLTLPVDDGSADQVLATNGSGVLSWVTNPVGSANTALSNLASLAINATLLPATINTINLGSYTKTWASLFLGNTLSFTDPSNTAGNTVSIKAADSTDAITYTLPPNNGNSNDVLITDGSGVLSWVSVATISGAANTALSNLASVAINTTLVSDTTNTDDLGSSSIRWKDLYLAGDIDITGAVGIDNSSPLADIHVGAQNVNNSVDSKILISRSVDNAVSGNGHAFSDSSDLNRNSGGPIAYDSYDARVTSSGTYNYDHYAGFQSLPSLATSGTTTSVYGLFSGLAVSNGGTVTNFYASYADNPTGTGTVTNAYGFYVEPLTKGATSNYAFFSEGTTTSVLGGSAGITTKATLGGLDISSGGLGLVMGADNTANTRTTNTLKAFRAGSAHYDNTEEPVSVFVSVNDNTANDLNIGGGSASFNAATVIKLATGATTTTTTGTVRLQVSSAGEITQPTQPSFLVTNSTGGTDVTGDNTSYTVPWGNEIYDQGANFASNTFTAPVTGRYHLQASVLLDNILVTHTTRYIVISTSNRNYFFFTNYLLAETNRALNASVMADMDANDTAEVRVLVAGSTKTVDVDADGTMNYFSGSLIN